MLSVCTQVGLGALVIRVTYITVYASFRLRLRLHLKLITVSFCLFACAELLLLRSGDVETHPGPAYNCAVSEGHSRSHRS